MDLKFDFDDILIVPEALSNVNSRKEVNVFDSNEMLPLFTAPMDTVISRNNEQVFADNKIYTIQPRNNPEAKAGFISADKFNWLSYGLDDFENIFLSNKVDIKEGDKIYALIDIANGNMKRLYDAAKTAINLYEESIVLMVGNVANPLTFKKFAELSVQYIRLGVGNGNACLTSENCGVGYPMASLISECYELKSKNFYPTKLVADGGFKGYADIIKALALGADYVMLGSIFNKAFESAGLNFYEKQIGATIEYVEYGTEIKLQRGHTYSLTDLMNYGRLYKTFRGMSTKEVQKDWGKVARTAEGVVKLNKVEYTLSQWCENFKDYLSSAMSYTSSFGLGEFKGSEFIKITENAHKRFQK